MDTTEDEDDAKLLRKRVEYEDQVLNARTNAVLVLNSLAAVAVASSMAERHIRLTVAIIMIVINGG